MSGAGHAQGLEPLRMPTSREECLEMLNQLIDDMTSMMSTNEFVHLYQTMPFDLAIKSDCENGSYTSAHQTAVGLRPTERSTGRVPKAPSGSSGGCFLTTACCEVIGLPDDCLELTVLRRFRDSVLPTLPGGDAEIALYYLLAPVVLRRLRGPRGREILKRVYFTHILPCVVLAWLGLGRMTRRRYRDMLVRLCAVEGDPAVA